MLRVLLTIFCNGSAASGPALQDLLERIPVLGRGAAIVVPAFLVRALELPLYAAAGDVNADLALDAVITPMCP